MFRPKTNKAQPTDKEPYVIYPFHSQDINNRNWQNNYRIISIDPANKNFAIRVEERLTYPTTLLFKRLSLSDNNDLTSVYQTLTYFLDQYLELFLTCHLVIVERQLPTNYRAVRISQHVISYFMLRLKDQPLLPIIIEINPKLKSKQLLAPSSLNDRGIKKWAIEKAIELLTSRSDIVGLNIINKERKKDDLADTVVQIEAFFNYFDLLSNQYILASY